MIVGERHSVVFPGYCVSPDARLLARTPLLGKKMKHISCLTSLPPIEEFVRAHLARVGLMSFPKREHFLFLAVLPTQRLLFASAFLSGVCGAGAELIDY